MHARRVGYLVTCVTLLAAGVVQAGNGNAGAVSTVSGNAAAIAYMRQVSAATQHMGGQDLTIVGEAAIKDYVSGQAWNVNTADIVGAAVPSGYVAATQYITVAADAGRITWIASVIVPSGCPTTPTPPCSRKTNDVTALFLLTKAGFFIHPYRYPSLCWSKSNGSVDGWSETGGRSGYPVYGDYRSLRRVGTTVVVVSTYPTSERQTATETDTIAAATHLVTATSIVVSSVAGHPGYTQHWANIWLSAEQDQPPVGALCHS